MKKMFLSLILFNLVTYAYAEVKISFPEEELATESVLPVFEEKIAVKNRKVNHKGRLEINFMAGMVTSEPIYNPFNFGASLTYHFDNTQAVHIMGTMFSDGLSSSGEDLRNNVLSEDDGTISDRRFDAMKAPHKQWLLAAHYQYTAYYGKISITRDNIMHLTLSGLLGGGVYNMDDLMVPTVNVGFSQRLYFNSWLALRMDILFSIYNGPDIMSAGVLRPEDPGKPDADEFDKSIQFDSNIYMGLSILL